MSRASRELSGDERALWRRVARTVKSKKPPPEEQPAEKPAAKVAAAKKPAAAALKPKAIPKPPPADRGAERRVKRGQVEIAAKIDLHGHTQDSALAALTRFLARAPAPSTVLVVTGKGRGGEEGVLRKRLPQWLASKEIRPLIGGFAQAHRDHGGAGAFYIFVRRS